MLAPPSANWSGARMAKKSAFGQKCSALRAAVPAASSREQRFLALQRA